VCVEVGLRCPSCRTERWSQAGRWHLRSDLFFFTQEEIAVDVEEIAVDVEEIAVGDPASAGGLD